VAINKQTIPFKNYFIYGALHAVACRNVQIIIWRLARPKGQLNLYQVFAYFEMYTKNWG
jgi:hypothetical protein